MSKEQKNKSGTSPDLQTAIYTELFPVAPTKGQKRVIQILEAAIENYATIGIDRTTYDTIAKTSGASRSLVQHYFKTPRELFETSAKYVRAKFQQRAVDAIGRADSPREKLRAYILSTFDWVDENRHHATLWILFYYYCGVDEAMQALNSQLVAVGENRIAEMLGQIEGRLTQATRRRAKDLQIFLTGALISYGTENLKSSPKQYRESVVRTAFSLAIP